MLRGHQVKTTRHFRPSVDCFLACAVLLAACRVALADFVVFDTTNTGLSSQHVTGLATLNGGAIAVANAHREVWWTDGAQWALMGHMIQGEQTSTELLVGASDSTVWYPTSSSSIGLLGAGLTASIDSFYACVEGFWGIPLGHDSAGALVASYGGFVPSTTLFGVAGVSRLSGGECVPVSQNLPIGGPWLVTRYCRDSIGGEWFVYQSSAVNPMCDSIYRVALGNVTRPRIARQGMVSSIVSDAKCTYIGTSGALWVVPNEDTAFGITSIQGAPLSGLWRMLIDSRGALWLGTGAGLYRVQEGDTVYFGTAANELPDNVVLALAEDGIGRVWIGTRSGIAVYAYPSEVAQSGTQGRGRSNATPEPVAVDLRGRRRSLDEQGHGARFIVTSDGVVKFRVKQLYPYSGRE